MKTEKYLIYFHHNTTKEPRGTACVIKDLKTSKELCMVKATLYYKDHFKRAKGRKASLTKVLSQMGLSREERRVIWDNYHKNFKC